MQASHFQPFVPPEFGLGGNSLSFSFEFSIGSRFIQNVFLASATIESVANTLSHRFRVTFESRTPCPCFAWTVALLGDGFPCPNLQISLCFQRLDAHFDSTDVPN